MKKIGVLSVIAIMGMSSVYAADYRASINNAIPKSNSGFQWNDFTKMTGVKWEKPQPKAFPQTNADGTLTYSMGGDFKKANKKQETAYIHVYGDKSKPDYFYVQHATDLPEDKFFQKSLANLVDLNQLTEINSNCSIPINSGVNPQRFYIYNKPGLSPLYIAHRSNQYGGIMYYNTDFFPTLTTMIDHINDPNEDSGFKFNSQGQRLSTCSFKAK